MNLYHLTLQKPTAINKCLFGQFNKSSISQQLIVSKITYLQLYSILQDHLHLEASIQVFGIIRDIAIITLHGVNKDLILISSDSGKINVFDYQDGKFIKLIQDTYGKSGCRRTVAGQFIAVDPKGRSFMIAAIQKQKLAYCLKREAQTLIISSPLQSHKSNSLCLSIIALEVGFDNCEFVSLQINYGDQEDPNSLMYKENMQKYVTIYQLDIGLNHIQRRSQFKVNQNANSLITLPLLHAFIVLSEGLVTFMNTKGKQIECKLPCRSKNNRIIITNSVVKIKDGFFCLLQNEDGDVFKLNIDSKNDIKLSIQYFDYLNISSCICSSNSGLLFAAGERSDHRLFRYEKLGQEKILSSSYNKQIVQYNPTKTLNNIRICDVLQNLSVITDIKVGNITGEPMIYVGCGQGQNSTLKILREGLVVHEFASSKFQSNPQKVHVVGIQNKYILLSYVNQTVPLSVGDKITQMKTSPFQMNQSTILALGMQQSMCQVCPSSIRIIKGDKTDRWDMDGKIVNVVGNNRQLTVALAGGQLIYYEMHDGKLKKIKSISLDSEVVSLGIGEPQQGRQRAEFLAIGLSNHTVRIISLSPDSCLKTMSIQVLPRTASSLTIVWMHEEKQSLLPSLFLFAGLQNGVLTRCTLDPISGTLSDLRNREMGNKPLILHKTIIHGHQAVICLSSRTWIIYFYMGKFHTHPLSYLQLHSIGIFDKQKMIALSNNQMKVFKIIRYGQIFNSQQIKLKYTPKKIFILPNNRILVLQGDHRMCKQSKQIMKLQEKGNWASRISIIDSKSNQIDKIIEGKNNQIFLSACILEQQDDFQIIVGSAQQLIFHPQTSFKKCWMRVFTSNMQLLHQTQIDQVVLSLCAWEDKILAGIGCSLRYYQIGKKRVLKKAQLKGLNSPVNGIHTMGDRIYITQLGQSFRILKYNSKDNIFVDVADDILPRWMTASCVLDYHTMAGTDKFQNFFISRSPLNADEDYENNPNSYKFRWEHGYLNGSPHKMEQLCSYYMGGMATCLTKTCIVKGRPQIILYGNTSGAMGAFYPFSNRQDLDFFIHLQMNMRTQLPPLLGRDHLHYRSYYSSCKGIIDGDLCQMFAMIRPHDRHTLQTQLNRTQQQIFNKLDQIRHNIL